MEQEIDLKVYLKVLKSGWKILVAVPLVAVLISAIFSFFIINPTYEATATILLQRKDKVDYEYNTIQANKELIKTYSKIALSRRVLERVKEEAKLDMPLEEIGSKVKVSTLGDSQILTFQVTDNKPEEAAKLANQTGLIFIEVANDITGMDNLRLVDNAIIPEKPIKPNKLTNILVAGIIGVLSAVGVVFIKDYFDGTFKEPQEIEELLKLPVIGVIPSTKENTSINLANMFERGTV